jgi:methyl-accepting chemotaxis protein
MPEKAKFDKPSSGNVVGSRFSLAAKLYSIFGLFAVLTAAITVLFDYNTRRNAELTEAIEIASRSAFNVERVNSLVYAVVMESRGIYMSTEPAVVKKYGDGLIKFNDQILAVVKDWESIVRADDAEQFAVFKKRIQQFVDFRKELVRRGVEISGAAGREWGDNDANRTVRTALNKDLEALSRVYAERSKEIARQTEANRSMAFVLTGLGGLALVLVCVGVLIISRSVARRFRRLPQPSSASPKVPKASRFPIPIAPTRSVRWHPRSRSSRRRWTVTATSMRRSCGTPGRVKNGPSILKRR